MKSLLLIAFTLPSVTYAIAEYIPEAAHLMKKICLEGTQYYYYKEETAMTLTPVIIKGKYQTCVSKGKKCTPTQWGEGINCVVPK